MIAVLSLYDLIHARSEYEKGKLAEPEYTRKLVDSQG